MVGAEGGAQAARPRAQAVQGRRDLGQVPHEGFGVQGAAHHQAVHGLEVAEGRPGGFHHRLGEGLQVGRGGLAALQGAADLFAGLGRGLPGPDVLDEFPRGQFFQGCTSRRLVVVGYPLSEVGFMDSADSRQPKTVA